MFEALRRDFVAMTCPRLVAVTCFAMPSVVAGCGDTSSDAVNGEQADGGSQESGGVAGGSGGKATADAGGAGYGGDLGGDSGGGNPDTGASGGVAGAAGTTVDAGPPRVFPVCQQDRYVEPSSDPACAPLDDLALVELRVEDSDGNGSVVPGEEAFVSVSYTNGGSQDVSYRASA
jgi:hypothetical protein